MPRRDPLTRERVLEAALRLADGGGLESVTMRSVARTLGVEAMSLYNHVSSKSDLVAALVDLVLDEIELPEEADAYAAIRSYAISANEVLLRHPWAAGLVLSGPSSPRSPRLRHMDWLLGRLREAGLSAELTYHAYHALDAHVVGFTLWQLGHAAGLKEAKGDGDLAALVDRFAGSLEGEYPHLAEHARQHVAAPGDDEARAFAFGLDLVLDGLRRAQTKRSP